MKGFLSTVRGPQEHFMVHMENPISGVLRTYGRRERKYLPLPREKSQKKIKP